MTNATRPACFSAKRPSPWTIRHVRSRPFIPSGHRIRRPHRPAGRHDGPADRAARLDAGPRCPAVQATRRRPRIESSYAGGYLVTGDYAVAERGRDEPHERVRDRHHPDDGRAKQRRRPGGVHGAGRPSHRRRETPPACSFGVSTSTSPRCDRRRACSVPTRPATVRPVVARR